MTGRPGTAQYSARVTDAARGLILVVEDEPPIAEVIRLNLAKAGFGVHIERDGDAGLAAIRAHRPAAVVLDIGLPGTDGIEVCRRLRAAQDWTPVLFVTARDDEVDRIVGLELGADDYLPKPFDFPELVARVRALGRRSLPAVPPKLTCGDVTLDSARRVASRGQRPLLLSPKEFAVLEHLLAADGRVVSAEELLAHVWDEAADPFTSTVKTTIARLRSKLGDPPMIETVREAGYRI